MSGDGPDLRAISLFSNCGAGDVGFRQAGFNFDVMAELDWRRLEVAMLNHPRAVGVAGDLRMTLPEVVDAYRSRAGDNRPALLAACPPCQGLSSAQSARGSGADPDVGSQDRRNLLVEVIHSAATQLQPRCIVVENVQAFLTRQVRHPETGMPVSAANYLIDSLSHEYVVYPLLADVAEFGVPQSRKRCFLTFLRTDELGIAVLRDRRRIPYPWPSHASGQRSPIILEDALSKLDAPSLDASSMDSARSDVPLHVVPVWSSSRYQMISAIPPRSGRSAWENDKCLECGEGTDDRTVALCSSCGSALPRPSIRDSNGFLRLITGFDSSYRRMDPALPAATITTASGHVGSDRTIHPWENRLLSPFECAFLQTFPSNFRWGDALKLWGSTNVRAMIGEAVPPLFTRKHGRILRTLLLGVPPRVSLRDQDRRMKAAEVALRRARVVSDLGSEVV